MGGDWDRAVHHRGTHHHEARIYRGKRPRPNVHLENADRAVSVCRFRYDSPPAFAEFGVTEPTLGADAGFHLFNGDGTGTDSVTFRIGTDIVLQNAPSP